MWKSFAAASPEPRLQLLRACVLSEQTDSPPLSPYPFVRLGSPRRVQLSQHHPVYISPHRNEVALSPQEKIFYYFSSSPSKVRLKGFQFDFLNSLTLFFGFGFGSEIRADSATRCFVYLVQHTHHHLRLLKLPVQLPQLQGWMGLWALHADTQQTPSSLRLTLVRERTSTVLKKIP